MTLPTLKTECQTCGAWALFAGRTSVMGGQTYAIAYCTQCRVDIPFWTPETEALVAGIDLAQILRSIAQRLCSVATGTEQEIRAALAAPMTPAPFGARECEITAGVLSVASVTLRFDQPILTRADLDRVFGQGETLPRTGPFASHVIAYDVWVEGAPACVTLLAAFRELSQATSAVKDILLRIDPLGVGEARARARSLSQGTATPS